jgi:hypothetical protein
MFFGLFDRTEKLKTGGKPRSPKWAALEKSLVAAHPFCALCGITQDEAHKKGKHLIGHHKLPFHLRPDLELDPANIAILCESRGLRDCHFLAGHLGISWDVYNPKLDDLCAILLPEVKRARTTG